MAFETTCPRCQEIQYAKPSIFHLMGALEMGRGTCLECENPFRLELILDEENKPNKMKATCEEG